MSINQLTCGDDSGMSFLESTDDVGLCDRDAGNREIAWVSQYRDEFMRAYRDDLPTAMRMYLTEPMDILGVARAICSWIRKINDRNEQGHESFGQVHELFHPYEGKIPSDYSDRIVLANSLAKLGARLMGLWLVSSPEDARKKLEAELAQTKAALAQTKAELVQTTTELVQTKAELAQTKAVSA
jgi:hypothetical protein